MFTQLGPMETIGVLLLVIILVGCLLGGKKPAR